MSHANRARTALALAGGAVFALFAVAGYSQTMQPTNDLPNPYKSIENWPKLPEGRTFGSTAGIDVDPDGSSIWVADRCGQFAPPSSMKPGQPFACDGSNLDPILKFDASGKLVKAFGAGMMIFPHSLHVDRQGNVWVTDGVGRNGKGQTVLKFSPDGKLLMTLGKPGVAGTGNDEFNAPSSVYVAPNGNIFVGDGHGGNTNARIVKFAPDGKFIKTWGKKGAGPGDIDIPHALAMDSRGRLFVGDRNNNRVQIFDQDGNYVDQWKQFSRPSGVYIDKNDVIYVVDSESNKNRNAGWKRGLRVGSAKDGSVTALVPDPEKDPDNAGTSAAEGVTADTMGNVFGAEVGPKRVMKYSKN
jgi:sugar lactone lactonase YvrE